jgi:hypothetical protein
MHTGFLTRAHELFREIDVHVLETAAVVAALVEYADEIDDGMATVQHVSERPFGMNVDAHEIDSGQDKQLAMARTVARRDADRVPESHQLIAQRSADEACAAEQTDDL